MKVYYGLDDYQTKPRTVVTSGTFDGVHHGHQKILMRLKEIAQQTNAETLVLTYHPHPRLVLYPDQTDLKLLSTLPEKIALLTQIGIDNLLILPFTKQFSQLSSQDFIDQILIQKINTTKLVIGYDHRFGNNREGSFEYLKANAQLLGFGFEEIPKQTVDEIAVSSTKIRNALLAGQIETANKYLGNYYQLSGKVIKGNQLGRTIGFPTANLTLEASYKLVPQNGVYVVRVKYENQFWNAMLNIGKRPTVSNQNETCIEVHLFDFDKDLYDQHLTIEFLAYLRNEQKFDSLQALQNQLLSDKQQCLDWFEN